MVQKIESQNDTVSDKQRRIFQRNEIVLHRKDVIRRMKMIVSHFLTIENREDRLCALDELFALIDKNVWILKQEGFRSMTQTKLKEFINDGWKEGEVYYERWFSTGVEYVKVNK
jgi:hypothetical protein